MPRNATESASAFFTKAGYLRTIVSRQIWAALHPDDGGGNPVPPTPTYLPAFLKGLLAAVGSGETSLTSVLEEMWQLWRSVDPQPATLLETATIITAQMDELDVPVFQVANAARPSYNATDGLSADCTVIYSAINSTSLDAIRAFCVANAAGGNLMAAAYVGDPVNDDIDSIISWAATIA